MSANCKNLLSVSASVVTMLAAAAALAPPAMAECRIVRAPGVVIACGNSEFDQTLTYDPDGRTLSLTTTGGVTTVPADFSGDDRFAIDGNDSGGLDTLRVRTTESPFLDLGAGDDRVVISEAILSGTILGGAGNDSYIVNATDGPNDATDPDGVAFIGGAGNDAVLVNSDSAAVLGVRGGDDDDVFNLLAGSLTGSVLGDDGNDRIVVGPGMVITGDVQGGAGSDRIRVNGAVTGDVDGGAGNDRIGSDGTISGAIRGGDGRDSVAIRGGLVGSVDGGSGRDQLLFSGGQILRPIEGFEIVSINEGRSTDAIVNDVVAISGDGTTRVRLIDTPVRGSGDPIALDLTDVDRFTARASEFSFAAGMDGINQLRVLQGSVFTVDGAVDLRRNGADGRLVVRSGTVDASDGDPTDSLRASELRFNNAQIFVDVNPNSRGGRASSDTLIVDQDIAGRIDNAFSGTNTLFIDFTEQPDGAVAIPIASIVRGEDPAAVAQALTSFDVMSVGEFANPLQTLTLQRGPGNQVLVVNTSRSASVTPGPVQGATTATSDDAVDDISSELADEGSGFGGGNRTQITPTFGVFASGQFSGTTHDGYDVSAGGIDGKTTDVDGSSFSLFGTGELDASEEFGLSDFGLRIAVFGGYVQTDVTLGRDIGGGLETRYEGSGYNQGGMLGTSVLVSKIVGEGNLGYAQLGVAGFLGSTDIVNADTGADGDYSTQGGIFSAKVGANLAVADNLYLDLRFGGGYTHFHGDSFTDESDQRYGSTRTSYGTLLFEPGISTAFLVQGARVSPSARLLFEQRVGYTNEASLNGLDLDYDDADFTFGGELGATANFTEALSGSAFVGGRLTEDQSTILGKLSVKYQF